MIKFFVAAIVGIAAITPAMAQQTKSTDTVLIAEGGRAYSGRAVQTDSADPSSPYSKSSSKPSPSPQPNPATDPVGTVGNAVKAGKDVLSIFGR